MLSLAVTGLIQTSNMPPQDLTARVEQLERLLAQLMNGSQLDPLVRKTITGAISGSSSKTAASATQSVNESGTSTYSVMKAPDGFISIDGKNVPYIN